MTSRASEATKVALLGLGIEIVLAWKGLEMDTESPEHAAWRDSLVVPVEPVLVPNRWNHDQTWFVWKIGSQTV